jgi:hypothetical protein
MFKIFPSILMLSLIFIKPSFAAYSGSTNPIIDGSLVALALEFDHVFDRKIQSSQIKDGKIKQASSCYLKLTGRPTDYLFLFAQAGGTNFDVKSNLHNGKSLNEKYDIGFFTGVGAKIVHEFMPMAKFSLTNQVNWWKTDLDSIAYEEAITEKSGYREGLEYQFTGILSYTIEWDMVAHPVEGSWSPITPYIGFKYSYLRLDNNITVKTASGYLNMPKIKNKNRAGIVCGLDMNPSTLGGFMLNLEFRFFDESAISGSLGYSF